jgi:hypothetical protein
LDDYANEINKYLGRERIDVVTINKVALTPAKRRSLCVKASDLVKFNPQKNPQRRFLVFKYGLIDQACYSYSSSDAIAYLRSPVRHDGEKVGRAIKKIYESMRG